MLIASAKKPPQTDISGGGEPVRSAPLSKPEWNGSIRNRTLSIIGRHVLADQNP
jgi:hypothetical protein